MNDTVTIHNHDWKRSDIAEQIEFCRTLSLHLQRWHPSPAQVQSGFRHEHCEICWWTIFESDDPDDGSGYTDGYRWVCRECYQQFLAANSNATRTIRQTQNAHAKDMNAEIVLAMKWGPYEGAIRECMVRLSEAPMPEQADFLWFVLMPSDLNGMPVIVWPTDRNQQQHDGWAYEDQLMQCVPDSVELSDLADTPERVDRLRDACAEFLMRQWQAIDPLPERLAYFSINDDGWYFFLRDGRRISAWDIENEISQQDAASNGDKPSN